MVLNALLRCVLWIGRWYALNCSMGTMVHWAECMGAPVMTAAAVLAD